MRRLQMPMRCYTALAGDGNDQLHRRVPVRATNSANSTDIRGHQARASRIRGDTEDRHANAIQGHRVGQHPRNILAVVHTHLDTNCGVRCVCGVSCGVR